MRQRATNHFAASATPKPLLRSIEVILPLAIADTYTYSVPARVEYPQIGMRVLVPLARKEVVGIVWRVHREDEKPEIEESKIRDIIDVLDTQPIVTEKQLQLWQWMSSYYMCPLGDVLAAALPAKALDRQYSIDSSKRRVKLPAFAGEIVAPHPLSEQQERAVGKICEEWQTKNVVLLQGVTSSGKTEVYIHLIEEMLNSGKQVLYLVPEIALTAQLTDRLACVFGDKLLVYHSRVTDAQRMETYRQVLTNPDPKVIIGARSAIFVPFNNIGLVIVDEEHEQSYKQQDPAPRYHARSVAIMLAQQMGAKVLLGTATPSVESRYNADMGKYGLAMMTERYQGLQLPKITMIDLERQYHRKEMYEHFSDPLVARIQEELGKGKQVILFQNRRGYAPYIQCVKCGSVPRCKDCDVSLTLHQTIRYTGLKCHYCGGETMVPSTCPECGGEMKVHGFGTERVEDEVARLFPEARVERMDLDSTRKKDAYQEIIRRFSEHDVDILIGTQMVTKGLHFDNVSLVAVLNADHLLNQPSFRSYERAFQMLEQVAGRAGRKGQQGEVIIQSFDVQHPVFEALQRHNVDGFHASQLQEREMFHYPPFTRLIMLNLKHRQELVVEQAASLLQQQLRIIFGERCSAVITPSIARLQNQYIRRMQLRIETAASLAEARRRLNEAMQILAEDKRFRSVVIQVDVDPM